MNFISYAVKEAPKVGYATELSIAAVLWRGDLIGEVVDYMTLFYQSTNRSIVKQSRDDNDGGGPRYTVGLSRSKADLLHSFGEWLKRSPDAVIVSIEADLDFVWNAASAVKEKSISSRLVNIEQVWALRNLEEYARRHNITPHEEMEGVGGELVRIADMRARCYRHFLSALSMQDLPVSALTTKVLTEIALVGTSTIPSACKSSP